MNNIFLRIYGGIVIAFLLISFTSTVIVDQLSQHRTQQYHSDISLGTLKIVADGAALREGSEREKWLQVVNRLLGERIEWHVYVPESAKKLLLDVAGQSSRDELVNFVETGNTHFTDIYVKIPGDSQGYLFVRLYDMTEQQIRGLAHLIVDTLGPNTHSGRGWTERFKKIQSYFNFPLEIKNKSELTVDLAQAARLERGEVVVGFSNGYDANSSFSVITPLLGESLFIEMGPVRLGSWLPINLVILGGVLSLALMALVVYLLVRPLQQRLSSMSRAVRKIRHGDLSVRVEVDGSDAVGRLGKSINAMAAHIQRLIQSQREMMNAVSHELRTPVARIRFGLEMMEDVDDSAMRNKQIQGIDSDIQELNTLIDEILTYARLEEGTPSLTIQKVDVEELVSQVIRETEAIGAKIKLEYRHIDTAVNDKHAECEERYIHRIIQNLVGNALRHANSRVRVSTTVEGGMYRLEVEDDGEGIPQQDWDKVFTPFARLDNSRTRASGGYGLGLSIVERIAYWHGGVASVNKSTDLGGARFTIIWPKTVAMREQVLSRQSQYLASDDDASEDSA